MTCVYNDDDDEENGETNSMETTGFECLIS